MKKWTVVLLSISLLILDKSFVPYFKIFDSYPSLLFTFALAYSIVKGRKEALFIGVLSGLLQDIFFGNVFGINALLNMILFYIAASVGENIYKEKKIVPVLLSIVLYLAKVLGILIIYKVLGLTVDLKIGIISSIYSSVIMLFSYDFIFDKFSVKEYKNSKWRF